MSAKATEYFRTQIRAYLAANAQDTNLLKFSKEVGVDYTTLHRLKEGKKSGVDFFDARRILSRVDPENWLSILEKFFPKEIAELDKSGLNSTQIDKNIATMQYVADSKDTYDVFVFVTEGLPKNNIDVTTEFGRRGLAILDDLIEHEAIVVGPDGQLSAFSNEVLPWPTNLLKAVARLNVDSIDAQSPGCSMRNLAMGLNLAGATEAYNTISEASNRLQAISKNEEYQGSLVMLFTLFCGVHSTKKYSEVQP